MRGGYAPFRLEEGGYDPDVSRVTAALIELSQTATTSAADKFTSTLAVRQLSRRGLLCALQPQPCLGDRLECHASTTFWRALLLGSPPYPAHANTGAFPPSTDPTGRANARRRSIQVEPIACPPTVPRPSSRALRSLQTASSPLQVQNRTKTHKVSPTLSTSCPDCAKTLTTLPGIGEATRPVDSAAEDEAPRAARPLGLVTVSSYLHSFVRVRSFVRLVIGSVGWMLRASFDSCRACKTCVHAVCLVFVDVCGVSM